VQIAAKTPRGKHLTKVPASCFNIMMVATLIETNGLNVIKDNRANKGTSATETSPKPSQK
jgi:hypothetical protein